MNLSELKQIMQEAGLRAQKRFSQNFLYEDSILERIASFIPGNMPFYLEIGGGLGALTGKAVERGLEPLTVVDLDDNMLDFLQKKYGQQADIQKRDGATLDFSEFYKGTPGMLFGNLPYQVSSLILFNSCYNSMYLDSAVFLLQKEVAEKVVSAPGDRQFSPIAALIHLIGDAELLFNIAPENFHPAPKVWSSLIKIRFKKHGYTREYLESFGKVMRILFSHRRKTLNNVFKINQLDREILETAGLSKTTRIEELPWESVVQLANLMMEQ
jgi:16S rRNA (adenine1518-N6/adenine1519-N6)-dimethyltransferase